MPRIGVPKYEYSEFCLGKESKQFFLRNVLNSLGYDYFLLSP